MLRLADGLARVCVQPLEVARRRLEVREQENVARRRPEERVARLALERLEQRALAVVPRAHRVQRDVGAARVVCVALFAGRLFVPNKALPPSPRLGRCALARRPAAAPLRPGL